MVILLDAENEEDRKVAKNFLGCDGIQIDKEEYNPQISELVGEFETSDEREKIIGISKHRDGWLFDSDLDVDFRGRYFAFKLKDINISDSIKNKVV